jgi:hypothetical protein
MLTRIQDLLQNTSDFLKILHRKEKKIDKGEKSERMRQGPGGFCCALSEKMGE